MTKEEIHSSLDKMLENPKSKTFINHLVRAYIPETKRSYIKLKPNTEIKCVLTGVKIISHQEADEIFKSDAFKDKIGKLKSTTEEGKLAEILAFVADGREEGCTGKDTTTFMSHLANMAFTDWVITKSLKGDKHINWLLGSIKRSSFIERAENIEDVDVQNKIVNIKKKNPVTTFTLGDASDVLSKLKKQMDSDGN